MCTTNFRNIKTVWTPEEKSWQNHKIQIIVKNDLLTQKTKTILYHHKFSSRKAIQFKINKALFNFFLSEEKIPPPEMAFFSRQLW